MLSGLASSVDPNTKGLNEIFACFGVWCQVTLSTTHDSYRLAFHRRLHRGSLAALADTTVPPYVGEFSEADGIAGCATTAFQDDR